MEQREYEMYQKAVGFIINNLDNKDFTTVLRQNGYKIIPCKLSYVIENLEKAGYTVTKSSTSELNMPDTIPNFNKEDFFNFIKTQNLSLYTIIKETTVQIDQNNIYCLFKKNDFFKYKQMNDNTNKTLLEKISSEYFNKNLIIQINIEKD